MNKKDARYFASLQIVEAVIWFQLNVCKRGLKLMKSPQPLFDLYVGILKNPYNMFFPSKETKKELQI